MITRSKRNIGKVVKINNPGSHFNGVIGTIKGFRGDWGRDMTGRIIPFVLVYIQSKINSKRGACWTFRGDKLEII